MSRPEIIGKPAAYYSGEEEQIPVEIRISFSDGTTEVYMRKPSLPGPLTQERIEANWRGYTPPGSRKGGSRT